MGRTFKPKSKPLLPVFSTVGGAPQAGEWKTDVLVFGPHPDDAEIAMGGTLLALKARGARVALCHLTDGEPTPRGDAKTRRREAERAARLLGVDDWRILPLKNRELVDAPPARRVVAEVIREVRPRLLFAPYWVDAHPDHWGGCALVEAARFQAKYVKSDMKGEPWWTPRLFHHFCCHLRPNVAPAFIVDVSAHFEKKMEAVAAYASQFGGEAGRAVFARVRTLHTYFGQQIGCAYGEPFFSRENLGVEDPRVFL